GAFDDAAAETDLAVVYHHVLARRDRALRRLEAHIDLAVIAMADPAGLVGLAIAHLCGERPVLRRRFVDPRGFHGSERGGEQQRMIMALGDDEFVRVHALADDIPWRFAAAPDAADLKPLALAQRVIGEADVLADDLAFGRDHAARPGRQVFLQELAEGAFADEADAGGILLR